MQRAGRHYCDSVARNDDVAATSLVTATIEFAAVRRVKAAVVTQLQDIATRGRRTRRCCVTSGPHSLRRRYDETKPLPY